MWTAVADDGLLLGGDGVVDPCGEALVGGFELVLAQTGGWLFVPLLEFGIAGVVGVVTDSDDGLRVVLV